EGAMAVRVTAAHTAEAQAEAGREAGEGAVAAVAAALAPSGFLGLPAPFSEEGLEEKPDGALAAQPPPSQALLTAGSLQMRTMCTDAAAARQSSPPWRILFSTRFRRPASGPLRRPCLPPLPPQRCWARRWCRQHQAQRSPSLWPTSWWRRPPWQQTSATHLTSLVVGTSKRSSWLLRRSWETVRWPRPRAAPTSRGWGSQGRASRPR
ncbi:E4F1 isoform 10, partial [Pan troglodytes]